MSTNWRIRGKRWRFRLGYIYLLTLIPKRSRGILQRMFANISSQNADERRGAQFELRALLPLRVVFLRKCVLEAEIPNARTQVDVHFPASGIAIELVSWRRQALMYASIEDLTDREHIQREINRGFNYSGNDFVDTQAKHLVDLCEIKASAKQLHQLRPKTIWLIADIHASDLLENYTHLAGDDRVRAIVNEFHRLVEAASTSYLHQNRDISIAISLGNTNTCLSKLVVIRGAPADIHSLRTIFGNCVTVQG